MDSSAKAQAVVAIALLVFALLVVLIFWFKMQHPNASFFSSAFGRPLLAPTAAPVQRMQMGAQSTPAEQPQWTTSSTLDWLQRRVESERAAPDVEAADAPEFPTAPSPEREE